jgi:hypoxia up-regulated 1
MTFANSRFRLAAFDASDKSRRVREEALNNLEAFTYKARDYLEDESFIAASAAALRTSLEEKLSAASEWISAEGHDAPEDVLKARLKELTDLVNPVLKRKDEAAKRPDAIKELRDAIDGLKSVIPMVKDNIESAAKASAKSAEEAAKASASSEGSSSEETKSADPLEELDEDAASASETATDPPSPFPTGIEAIYSEADVQTLEDAVAKGTAWLEEKEAAQSKLSSTEDPAFTVAEINAQAKKANDVVMEMMTKKFRHLNRQTAREREQKAKEAREKAKKKKEEKKSKKEKKKDKEQGKEKKVEDEKKNPDDGPSEAELRDASKKAGIKEGEGIKLENLGPKKAKDGEEILGADGKPLVKLELGEDASEEDILAAIDRIVGEGREAKKERKHDEL